MSDRPPKELQIMSETMSGYFGRDIEIKIQVTADELVEVAAFLQKLRSVKDG